MRELKCIIDFITFVWEINIMGYDPKKPSKKWLGYFDKISISEHNVWIRVGCFVYALLRMFDLIDDGKEVF